MGKPDLTIFYVTDNKEFSQFELTVKGYLSKIEYSIKEGKIFLIHTEVPEELAGQGIAGHLTKESFKIIEKQGTKIVPMCSFVREYMRKHPEFRHLLAQGIKID